MLMQIGDKLYCKKDFRFRNSSFHTGEYYIITHMKITTCALRSSEYTSVGFYLNNTILESDTYKYLWNHFETKTDRAKRIIDGYKNSGTKGR